MIETIKNCYDSHTHFWATGQVAEGLNLGFLKSADDVRQINLKPAYYRNNWLVGFGWNQNNWLHHELPDKKNLDEVFKDTPVFFSRVDGHASWLNTAALNALKAKGYDFNQDIQGGAIERDLNGEPTGVLFDQAHIKALLMLPEFSTEQNIQFFKTSQRLFNQAGFTHVRDLSMWSGAWNLLRQLEDKNELTVAIESFVTIEKPEQFESILPEIQKMKNDISKQLRLNGVKIFIDGSLGSKTAALTENYLNTKQKGLLIWSEIEIQELIKKSWQAGLQVAIHCIGDRAGYTAARAAREVSAQGILGRLHLEHVQLLSTETVQMLKPLHVVCYMQPCHWLSDHSWLKESISSHMISKLFRWELLRKNKIPFYFGSDSPIERPSLLDNKRALIESAEWGIEKLNADWKFYHQHPDLNWNPSYTEIENDQVKQVFFNGRALF
ncbi:MAG: amidohydrolase [Pseudobdellovibrio sp.]